MPRLRPSYGVRPQGNRRRISPDVYRLGDEHNQPVEIWSPKEGKWWWAFHLVEENDKVWNGPFRTRKSAIADSEAYCRSA